MNEASPLGVFETVVWACVCQGTLAELSCALLLSSHVVCLGRRWRMVRGVVVAVLVVVVVVVVVAVAVVVVLVLPCTSLVADDVAVAVARVSLLRVVLAAVEDEENERPQGVPARAIAILRSPSPPT